MTGWIDKPCLNNYMYDLSMCRTVFLGCGKGFHHQQKTCTYTNVALYHDVGNIFHYFQEPILDNRHTENRDIVLI